MTEMRLGLRFLVIRAKEGESWIIKERDSGIYLARPSRTAEAIAPWCLLTLVHGSTSEDGIPPEAVWKSEEAALEFVSSVLNELYGRMGQ